MPDITRRATFYAAKKGGPKTFHLETDGAIVNVTVGLTDSEGRAVTRVDVVPDDETRGGDAEGRVWRYVPGDARIVRQPEDVTPGAPGPEQTLRRLVESVRTQVAARCLPAHEAAHEVTERALQVGLQVPAWTAAHLVIDPTADLTVTPATGSLVRITLTQED